MSTLMPGIDFNCLIDDARNKQVLCYGIGTDNDDTLRQVQMQINRYAQPMGFAPIAIDGKIGESTRAALVLPAALIRARDASAPEFISWAADGTAQPSDIATNARDFIVMLAAAAPAYVEPTPSPSPSRPLPVAMQPSMPGVQPSPRSETKTLPRGARVAIGAAGLLIIAAGVGWVAYRTTRTY